MKCCNVDKYVPSRIKFLAVIHVAHYGGVASEAATDVDSSSDMPASSESSGPSESSDSSDSSESVEFVTVLPMIRNKISSGHNECYVEVNAEERRIADWAIKNSCWLKMQPYVSVSLTEKVMAEKYLL